MVRVEDLMQNLKARIAILPGSRDRQRRPIIFVPFENQSQNATREQIITVITYLLESTIDGDKRNKFVFVVDMRRGASNNVLKTFLKILEEEPNIQPLISNVLIIKPEKFLDKHKASVTAGKYSFEVQTVAVDQLTKTMDSNQILYDFGGHLIYDHDEWIEIRKNIETFVWQTSEILRQLDAYSVEIRACGVANDLSTPDMFFNALSNIHRELSSINADRFVSFVDDLGTRIAQSKSLCQNPDFANVVHYLQQQVGIVKRAQAEVVSLLNKRKSDLNRDFNLRSFEMDAMTASKKIISYSDAISRSTFKIGSSEKDITELIKQHQDVMKTIEGYEVTYKMVIDTGNRLLDPVTGTSMQVERLLRQLEAEWASLKRKLEDRAMFLKFAQHFHEHYGSYMRNAAEWIHNVGVDPSRIPEVDRELERAAVKHSDFKAEYELAYSEAMNSATVLRSKLETMQNLPGSSRAATEKQLLECLDSIVRYHKQISNIWQSRNMIITQRLSCILLFPEINTVIHWLKMHGEPFLQRKVAIGTDHQTAKSLEVNHQKFRDIAQNTYRNATELFKTADTLIKNGEVDEKKTREAVSTLRQRIDEFTLKVDSRTKLLYVATNFFMHYQEIMDYYDRLDQRDRKIRVVASSRAEAEQNKVRLQQTNNECDQAFGRISAEARQLLDELQQQKRLLGISNQPTVDNIESLITKIQERHGTEKGRWSDQREILKLAASVAHFREECESIYTQITGWRVELQSLAHNNTRHQHMAETVAGCHNTNMINVEQAVRDALKRTNRLTEQIEKYNLVMPDGESAVKALMNVARKLKDLKDDVMKIAKDISERFELKKVFDKISQQSLSIKSTINAHMRDLRTMPCLAYDSAQAEEQLRRHEEVRVKTEALNEVVITFEQNFAAYSSQFVDLQLFQQLKIQLDDVKTNFAQLVHMLDTRLKLIQFGYQYYRCLRHAIPAIDAVEKKYSSDCLNDCAKEQQEDLIIRRDNLKALMQAHGSQKDKFLKGAVYAQHCADQFNNSLRKFEEDAFRMGNSDFVKQSRLLQDSVTQERDNIRTRQEDLLKLWGQRCDELRGCIVACFVEISTQQIIDLFSQLDSSFSSTVPKVSELSRSIPRTDLEKYAECVADLKRRVKNKSGEIRKTIQHAENFKKEHSSSYHLEFVERAARALHEHYRHYVVLVGDYESKIGELLGHSGVRADRNSDGSLEEKISHQSEDSGFVSLDENGRKLRDAMKELISSESDYVNDLKKCIEVYVTSYRMEATTMPKNSPLYNCEDKLFGNIDDLHKFHNEFLKVLRGYEQNPEDVGCCFFIHVDRLKKLYTEYILNKDENDDSINQPEAIQLFEQIQRKYKLEPSHTLQSMLIKPVQRITRYPLLLNLLMKHSTENRSVMQTALETVQNIPRAANDLVHLKNFEDSKAHAIGDFVMQDSLLVTESKRYFRREKELQVFLFESNIVFTKKEELSAKKFRYLKKYHYLLSDIHVVEHVEGDSTKFGLRRGRLPQGEQTILKASDEESKKIWVKTLRELVLEMPLKTAAADPNSNGSVRSEPNVEPTMRKLSMNEAFIQRQRFSNASIGSTDSNKPAEESHVVEMRRPRPNNNGQSTLHTPSLLSEADNFLLPLDSEENHYENLLSDFGGFENGRSAGIVSQKRSTVSSTASSDGDLPPAMEQITAVVATGSE